jgi:hypothetical protein
VSKVGAVASASSAAPGVASIAKAAFGAEVELKNIDIRPSNWEAKALGSSKTGNAIIDRYYVELLHDQRTLAHVLHVIIVVVKEALARCRNLLRRGSLSSFP